jgi:hypothetical protein
VTAAHPVGLFRVAALAALSIHAVLLFGAPGLRGGADLLPHLALMERMAEAPALRTTYAPAYHALGALLARIAGLAEAPRLFAFGSAVLLLAGFRVFQRTARLPDASAALFCFFPFGFTFSWCLPKVEAAGTGVALLGLAALLAGRRVAAAVALAAAFHLHTASALFLGLTGGVLCLACRDARGLAALAAGTLGALPLLIVHLQAGCSLPQALLFSEADYLRATRRWSSFAALDVIGMLSGPVALGSALLGAPLLWRRHREVSIVGAVVVFFYLNELWMSPFPTRTTLDLLRGLTILALPVCWAGGLWLGETPGRARLGVALAALWAVLVLGTALPRTCHVERLDLATLEGLQVERCRFRWRGPHLPRPGAVPGSRSDTRSAQPAPGASSGR